MGRGVGRTEHEWVFHDDIAHFSIQKREPSGVCLPVNPSLPHSLLLSITLRHCRQSQKMSSSAKLTSVPGLASLTDKSCSRRRSTISASMVATRGPGGAGGQVEGRGRGRVASMVGKEAAEEDDILLPLPVLVLLLLIVVAVLVVDNMECWEHSGKNKAGDGVRSIPVLSPPLAFSARPTDSTRPREEK